MTVKKNQNMKNLIQTSEYFDKSAINVFSGPTVQDILFCSLKSSAVRIVAKLDLLCGRIRGGLDFRIFDLRISHLIFIWISIHYTYDFMFSGSLVIEIGCYRKKEKKTVSMFLWFEVVLNLQNAGIQRSNRLSLSLLLLGQQSTQYKKINCKVHYAY